MHYLLQEKHPQYALNSDDIFQKPQPAIPENLSNRSKQDYSFVLCSIGSSN